MGGDLSETPSQSSSSTQVSYASYLKVPELISLQKPLSEPPAHDELLFIIVHQTYELWFKQVLFEMETLVGCLLKDDLIASFRYLDRISEIFKVLVSQVDILETMTPVDFNRFRSHLNPASGFQSVQFREMEALAGLDVEAQMKSPGFAAEWKNSLTKRLKGTTLRAAFMQLLAARGLLPSRQEQDLPGAILKVYNEEKHRDLYSLCESLIGFDEQVQLWRFRHVQMVERMIGMKRGTGGSLGVPYLQGTLRKRFFPELWEARTEMGAGAY